MGKLLTASLLGACLVAASTTLAPTVAFADGGYYAGSSCSGPLARFRRSCRSARINGGVPTDPSVPEPGAAALFALGAGVIAARSRRAR